MRLATWNINSVRLRMPIVAQFTESHKPDVLCLQETKVEDSKFPLEDIKALGYEHVIFRGMKGYNGVAILSRLPLTDTGSRDWAGKEDCRHVAVDVDGKFELHNFYIPAGGDEPNPEVNEKFDHKLRFLDEMRDWFKSDRKATKPMVLVGDLNIAPLENDVWSHKQLLKVVSHTPIEVEKLTAFQNGLKWVDAVRAQIPEPEKLYSWWSYRSRDWQAANKGRRLDHVWVTAPLAGAVTGVDIVKDARGWEKPSDHVPVIVDFNL
ncbi:exodeoxyribonuclease III [Hwanghaeella grinnelliae]|uniref:Exodeoxyribonuclease III n=1 Tax=Hwanghaeella grinnelliae TaxID=2500179 RepID=A0A3S2VQ01_9PROT|nr:exodeoxyribonuclease III [Hwanghaeella grinnelliae]RVU36270.1 exodeoxyribonuclease III [Hwanghaeella grinnelliae]